MAGRARPLPDPDCWTISQYAALKRVDRKTVRAAIDRGQIITEWVGERERLPVDQEAARLRAVRAGRRPVRRGRPASVSITADL
jgi:hypothetical protein